jgi:hypothetical protein
VYIEKNVGQLLSFVTLPAPVVLLEQAGSKEDKKDVWKWRMYRDEKCSKESN